jgi:hypothetical protein
MSTNIFQWLSDWYIKNCNGDWEHDYGILIETIDNPGWHVTIDVQDSIIDIENRQWKYSENSPNDWFGFKVEEGKFDASGDPTKLEYLILLFKEITEEGSLPNQNQ